MADEAQDRRDLGIVAPDDRGHRVDPCLVLPDAGREAAAADRVEASPRLGLVRRGLAGKRAPCLHRLVNRAVGEHGAAHCRGVHREQFADRCGEKVVPRLGQDAVDDHDPDICLDHLADQAADLGALDQRPDRAPHDFTHGEVAPAGRAQFYQLRTQPVDGIPVLGDHSERRHRGQDVKTVALAHAQRARDLRNPRLGLHMPEIVQDANGLGDGGGRKGRLVHPMFY